MTVTNYDYNRLQLFNNRSSCLELAVDTDQQEFVAHSAIQGILDAAWYGSIKDRDISKWRIFAAIFCFPFLSSMDIKPRAELTMQEEPDNEKQKKELPLWEKFRHFHAGSPLVKLVEHTMGYLLFLMLFSYVAILEKTSTSLGWTELLLVVTVFGYFVAEMYQLVHSDTSASASDRLREYIFDFWNFLDILCITIFVMAVFFRCRENTIDIGHLLYALDVSLWILRLIQVLYADQVTGPYVVMIGNMLSDMFNFLIILFIFLLSYGVAVTATLQPGALESPSQVSKNYV